RTSLRARPASLSEPPGLRQLFGGLAVRRDLHPFPTRRSSDLPLQPKPGEGLYAPTESDEDKESGRKASSTVSAAALHARIARELDRKSTRLNSSHVKISYAVFCWKKTPAKSLRYSAALQSSLP